MKYVFPAVLELDKYGVYLVSFPDLEGCYTDGATMEEAVANAKDVLSLMLCDMEDREKNIPQPTPFNQIKVNDQSFVHIIQADTDEYRKLQIS